jgi:AbrB family looped-hinge helix DNA binding protein
MRSDANLADRQRARLTRQGHITVPKAVRDALGIRPGDDIEFVPRGSELLVEVRPRRSLAAAALEVGPAAVVSFDEGLDSVEGYRRVSA